MSSSTPEKFENVTVACKANVYFDGKVVSHVLTLADGSTKTLGIIFPGTYTFNTDAPELMEIVSGSCRVRIADEEGWTIHGAGSAFEVPGKSRFEIAVAEGIAEYICSFR